MRVRVDKAADAVYLDLTGADIESSEEIAPGMIADYDAEGHLVGIERWRLPSVRVISVYSKKSPC